METLKKRSEIAKSDCWDLTHIIENEEEFIKLIDIAKNRSEEIIKLKGHILDNEDTLEKFLNLNEEEERALDRLIVYSKLSYDEDTNNNKNKSRLLEIENLEDSISVQESFIKSELMEKDYEYVLSLLEKKDNLKKFKTYFRRLYRNKERVLSEKEEELISKASMAFGTPDDAFTSLDVTDASFKPVNGESLNHYNYGVFLENKEQKIRREAFLNYHEYYKKHKNTFASLLKGNYQELEFFRDIRKYNSALEMALNGIEVSADVYENLISSVHKYMDLNIEFQKIKAKLLGVKEYHLYDTYVPVVEMPEKKYTKDEAIEIVSEALKPLGEDYLNHFKAIFDAHTVDFYSSEGKENGAYQWGCYDSPSYVLLNFNGTLDSVSTLAHELGHGVHSMYSKENNDYTYSSYLIFLAEIASTVNEMLLSEYNYSKAESNNEKIYYLCEFLDKVKGTIYRQTMFSEFEQIISDKCQNKESLTEEVFSDTYYELNKEYFKDSVILDEDIRYEEYRISHFYRPFYVYQYATGLISAICITSSILNKEEGFPEKYIDFLKSGCKENPLDILNKVNVDLTNKETYKKAFKFISNKLEELKSIVKEGELDE